MSSHWIWHPSGAGLFTALPPGFAAGFSTRQLAERDGSALASLADALGAPEAERIRVRQVHGRDVVVLSTPPVPARELRLGPADALATGDAGRLLAVESADCVPVLLLEPGIGWIAALHAGWRGTALRIVDAVLDTLLAQGGRTEKMLALFGPSIARDRYEVGPEVADALRDALDGAPVDADVHLAGERDRSFVDVAAHDRALLLRRGVLPGNIRMTGLCNAADAVRFPSYRRDGASTGRILTGIVRLW
ncbi:MAG: polyphenol oxidase family protein [Thermoanaerobaculia bacterium]